MPIFVYRCECGHRFERIVPRDAAPPACPECAGATRKIPAGPSLTRGSSGGSAGGAGRGGPSPAAGRGGSVPIPWRGVVSGGPEKMRREVEFRQRLEAKASSGIRTPGGPERQVSEEKSGKSGGTGKKSGDAAASSSG